VGALARRILGGPKEQRPGGPEPGSGLSSLSLPSLPTVPPSSGGSRAPGGGSRAVAPSSGGGSRAPGGGSKGVPLSSGCRSRAVAPIGGGSRAPAPPRWRIQGVGGSNERRWRASARAADAFFIFFSKNVCRVFLGHSVKSSSSARRKTLGKTSFADKPVAECRLLSVTLGKRFAK